MDADAGATGGDKEAEEDKGEDEQVDEEEDADEDEEAGEGKEGAAAEGEEGEEKEYKYRPEEDVVSCEAWCHMCPCLRRFLDLGASIMSVHPQGDIGRFSAAQHMQGTKFKAGPIARRPRHSNWLRGPAAWKLTGLAV